jgi:hypothetical protein
MFRATLNLGVQMLGGINGPHRVRIMSCDVSAKTRESYDSRFCSRQVAQISALLLGTILTGSWALLAAKATPAVALQLGDISSGQLYYANARPYIEDPVEQLVDRIPELKALQPAQDQQALLMILGKTAVNVDQFFRDAVDLLANEEITREKLSAKGATKSRQSLRYNYLILLHRDESAFSLEEYRTDVDGNRVDLRPDKGYSITSGFALNCIHFASRRQSDSTFRYLGDEMIGARNTYVVAFAQRPGRAKFTGMVGGPWGSVVIMVQGIAWVDKNTFQLVRLRTDLLAPRGDIGLERQTTEENFTEVQLADIPSHLSLPSDVSVYAVFNGKIFRNEHHYTDYQRYRVSVKIVVP